MRAWRRSWSAATSRATGVGAYVNHRVRTGVLIAVAVAIACASVAPTAEAAGLHLRQLATSPALPVGAGATGQLAYLTDQTSLAVRTSGQATRVHRVPAGCRPQALAKGLVALACPGTPPEVTPMVAVLDSATGAITPVATSQIRAALDGIRSIGAQWLVADVSSSADRVHAVGRSVLVNWHTGETRELASADPYAKRGMLELDAPTPTRRLCQPITRTTSLAKVLRLGDWVLQAGSQPSLRTCGQRTAIRFAAGSRAVLGQDFVGYLQGRRVIHRDLRSNVRSTTPWPSRSRPFLALLGRRLIVTTGRADSYKIYEASRS